jgi:hypothetical protein
MNRIFPEQVIFNSTNYRFSREPIVGGRTALKYSAPSLPVELTRFDTVEEDVDGPSTQVAAETVDVSTDSDDIIIEKSPEQKMIDKFIISPDVCIQKHVWNGGLFGKSKKLVAEIRPNKFVRSEIDEVRSLLIHNHERKSPALIWEFELKYKVIRPWVAMFTIAMLFMMLVFTTGGLVISGKTQSWITTYKQNITNASVQGNVSIPTLYMKWHNKTLHIGSYNLTTLKWFTISYGRMYPVSNVNWNIQWFRDWTSKGVLMKLILITPILFGASAIPSVYFVYLTLRTRWKTKYLNADVMAIATLVGMSKIAIPRGSLRENMINVRSRLSGSSQDVSMMFANLDQALRPRTEATIATLIHESHLLRDEHLAGELGFQ